MQNKYKLPKSIYQATLWVIRGQEERERKYRQDKDEILNSGGASYIKRYNSLLKSDEYIYLPKGHSSQSAVEIKALALLNLEKQSETKHMYAVQQALDEAVSGTEDPEKIKLALMNNISDRNGYPFRNLGCINISEKTFYNIKHKLIYLVAKKINLI